MSKYYVGGIMFDSENAISHHGVKGQKWGNRKYQYEDGSLTAEGRRHYGIGDAVNAAGRAVSNAAKSLYGTASSRVGGAYNSVNRAARGAASSARDYYTGESHRRNAANMLAAKRGARRTTREIPRQWENMSPAEQAAALARYDNAIDEYVKRNNSSKIEYEQNAYQNAPRQRIQRAVDKGKSVVEQLEANRKSLMTRISDMARDVVNRGRSIIAGLMKRFRR